MSESVEDTQPAKYCPLIKAECLQDECVFWIRSSETVSLNCAVVVIAHQLDNMANRAKESRLS